DPDTKIDIHKAAFNLKQLTKKAAICSSGASRRNLALPRIESGQDFRRPHTLALSIRWGEGGPAARNRVRVIRASHQLGHGAKLRPALPWSDRTDRIEANFQL